MAEESSTHEQADIATTNYEHFRECLSELVISQLAPITPVSKPKKRSARVGRRSVTNVEPVPVQEDALQASDAEDLADFIEYLAGEIFPVLPEDLRGLSYTAIRNDPTISAAYTSPIPRSTLDKLAGLLPPSTLDSLSAYGLLPPSSVGSDADPDDLRKRFVEPLFTSYTTAVTTPPPSSSTLIRASACEICARDWIPLSYHHLIPRSTHARVLKRGWHEEWQLSSVAWLCRACHSMVHRVESNESLARSWYSVELLMGREDVRAFAGWVGGVRWKAR